MILCLLAANLFSIGDHWSYDVTVRYQNTAQEIDLVDKEALTFTVTSASANLTEVDIERRFVASLVGEDEVPPAKGTEPEHLKFSFDGGKKIVSYKGSADRDIDRAIKVLLIGPGMTLKREFPKSTDALAFERARIISGENWIARFAFTDDKGFRADGTLGYIAKSDFVSSLTFKSSVVYVPGTTQLANLSITATLKDRHIKNWPIR